MKFELTVLGSASALPTSTKFPAAQVLNVHERFFLIDCGEGTQMQLRKAKISFGKLNHIFISHIHGDHIFGLFGILSSFNLLGRKTPLHVYGHPAIERIITFYAEQFAPEMSYEIVIHGVSGRNFQQVYEDKAVEIFAFPLKHRIPCFGYLFRERSRPLNIKKDAVGKYNLTIKQIKAIKNGEDVILGSGEKLRCRSVTEAPYKTRSFAYCSDTALDKKIIPCIKQVDLLYHESTFSDTHKSLARTTGHSTAKQAAYIARESKAKKLLIGHFSNRYKEEGKLLEEAREVFPDTLIAEDLGTYSVPLTREKNY
ncbi:MAG: ribonuclease Z [Bacteroidales bacterium]|jgi:ribonuclease Z